MRPHVAVRPTAMEQLQNYAIAVVYPKKSLFKNRMGFLAQLVGTKEKPPILAFIWSFICRILGHDASLKVELHLRFGQSGPVAHSLGLHAQHVRSRLLCLRFGKSRSRTLN